MSETASGAEAGIDQVVGRMLKGAVVEAAAPARQMETRRLCTVVLPGSAAARVSRCQGQSLPGSAAARVSR